MNLLKIIIRELDQHFKLSNFFVNRQYLKIQKNTTSIHVNTQQPFNLLARLKKKSEFDAQKMKKKKYSDFRESYRFKTSIGR